MSRFTGPVRGRSLAALAAAVVVLAASGSSAAAASRGAAAGAPRFPLTIHAANGTMRIARRPDRIVSLSASATEDLYAVGAGKQVVAVDSYSTYPKQAPHTKLSAFSPNVEAIAKYRPDLVVISNDQDNIAAQLGKLQIPVLSEPAAANLGQLYGEIDQLGRATGHPAGARQVIARMKRQIAAIVRSTPRPNPPLRVYHELDQTYYSASSNTFIGQMYSLLGVTNIADAAGSASPYPQLSGEYIISADPDLIVLADTVCCGQNRTTVAARPGWDTITAVKRGEIVPVDDSIASEWGPRIVLFLRSISKAVKTIEAHR